jgi:hypothetical protein
MRNDYKILHGNRENHDGKIPPGSPRRGWEDTIKIDPKQIGWEDMEWIHLAQDRVQWRVLVNTVINILVL